MSSNCKVQFCQCLLFVSFYLLRLEVYTDLLSVSSLKPDWAQCSKNRHDGQAVIKNWLDFIFDLMYHIFLSIWLQHKRTNHAVCYLKNFPPVSSVTVHYTLWFVTQFHRKCCLISKTINIWFGTATQLYTVLLISLINYTFSLLFDRRSMKTTSLDVATKAAKGSFKVRQQDVNAIFKDAVVCYCVREELRNMMPLSHSFISSAKAILLR